MEHEYDEIWKIWMEVWMRCSVKLMGSTIVDEINVMDYCRQNEWDQLWYANICEHKNDGVVVR